jgi:hypothetical protein
MAEATALPGLNESLLFKYGKLGPHSEAVFTGSSVWFSGPRQLNDPFECRPAIIAPGASIMETFFGDFWVQDFGSRNLAMYCVSRRIDILMWSHYADEHKGYCLAFSESGLCSHFDQYSDVTYQDTYPELAFQDSSPEAQLTEAQVKAFVLTKYSGWSYEDEVRFLSWDSGASLREYPPQHLRAVILGARMDATSREKVRDWLAKRASQPLLYEARLSTSRFALEFRELK